MARHQEKGVLVSVTPKQNVGKTTDFWKSTLTIVQTYTKKNGVNVEKFLVFDVLGEELCDAVASFFENMHGQAVVVDFYVSCKPWVNDQGMKQYFTTLQLAGINPDQPQPQYQPQRQYQQQPQRPNYPPMNGQPQPQVYIRQGQGRPQWDESPF